MEKRRDYNIDFFRGIATLWIIFIHTCFWSGEEYVPSILRQISLIIDVPIFMFISGMSFNFNKSIFKNIKGFIKLWGKYLIFLIMYFIILLIIDIDNFNVLSVIKAIFFDLSDTNKLKVVGGSFWFIYMFIWTSLLSSIVIKIYNYFFKDLTNFKYVLLFVLLLYGMNLYYPSFVIFKTQTLFYSFIYLLGYYLYNYKINLKTFILTTLFLIILVCFMIRYGGYAVNLQQAKFDYNINYFVYSMISITLVTYLKDKISILNNNLFVFIGQNSLIFYLCQGIGASLIYYFLDYIVDFPLILKILFMYTMNFIITFILTLLLLYLIKLSNKVIFYLKNKMKFISLELK